MPHNYKNLPELGIPDDDWQEIYRACGLELQTHSEGLWRTRGECHKVRCQSELEIFREDVGIALKAFRDAIKDYALARRRSDVRKGLVQIAQAASQLQELLNRNREAQDLMVRKARPGLAFLPLPENRRELDNPYQRGSRVFEIAANEMRRAAQRASDLKDPAAYLRKSRTDQSLSEFIRDLIEVWKKATFLPPTFSGTSRTDASPFIRFLMACLDYYKRRYDQNFRVQSVAALVKSCERIRNKQVIDRRS